MKKRTVKDFIALYASEDEEKLVLIQDGISADKTSALKSLRIQKSSLSLSVCRGKKSSACVSILAVLRA